MSPVAGRGRCRIWNAASFGAGRAVCSCAHVGHGRGLCNKNSSDYRLMQRAMMWQLHISLCELAKQDYGSGQPVFWLKMFPQSPGCGFKRPKSVLFHREVLPATVRMDRTYTIRIFPNGRVTIIEEIGPDKSVHVLVVIATKWLGHPKPVPRQQNRPCYDTDLFFCVFIFSFNVSDCSCGNWPSRKRI